MNSGGTFKTYRLDDDSNRTHAQLTNQVHVRRGRPLNIFSFAGITQLPFGSSGAYSPVLTARRRIGGDISRMHTHARAGWRDSR